MRFWQLWPEASRGRRPDLFIRHNMRFWQVLPEVNR